MGQSYPGVLVGMIAIPTQVDLLRLISIPGALRALGRGETIVRAAAGTNLSRVPMLSAAIARITRVHANPSDAARRATTAAVTALVYELLDAHHDTVRLARDLADDASWQQHLDYLRGLQRVGRETLAHLPLNRAA